MADKDKYNIIAIVEAIEKIFQYSRQYSTADELYNCNRDFDASMMNFIVIGEMVARLSDEFTMENSHIDWHKIKEFRNMLAHDYFGIDAEEVWDIIKKHLPKLKSDVEEISNI